MINNAVKSRRLKNVFCVSIVLTVIIFSPEYSLERLMLKLKLQYSGHLMQRTDTLEKTTRLGMIEGRRRRRQQRDGWMASSI